VDPVAGIEPEASSVTGGNPPLYVDAKLSHSIPKFGEVGVMVIAAVGRDGQLA